MDVVVLVPGRLQATPSNFQPAPSRDFQAAPSNDNVFGWVVVIVIGVIIVAAIVKWRRGAGSYTLEVGGMSFDARDVPEGREICRLGGEGYTEDNDKVRVVPLKDAPKKELVAVVKKGRDLKAPFWIEGGGRAILEEINGRPPVGIPVLHEGENKVTFRVRTETVGVPRDHRVGVRIVVTKEIR